METTIRISREIKQRLDNRKMFRNETYNDIIEVLLEDDLELSKKTKKELSERSNEKTISHEEVKKRLGP